MLLVTNPKHAKIGTSTQISITLKDIKEIRVGLFAGLLVMSPKLQPRGSKRILVVDLEDRKGKLLEVIFSETATGELEFPTLP